MSAPTNKSGPIVSHLSFSRIHNGKARFSIMIITVFICAEYISFLINNFVCGMFREKVGMKSQRQLFFLVWLTNTVSLQKFYVNLGPWGWALNYD